jgi:Cu2+-exporting ATPase
MDHGHNPEDHHEHGQTLLHEGMHDEGTPKYETQLHEASRQENPKTHQHGAGGGHQHALEDFKRRFIVSVILTIPILVLSPTIQMLFGFPVEVPYAEYLVFILASGVYVYGGIRFSPVSWTRCTYP